MMTATHANEYRYNAGHDLALADAYDAEYLDEAPEAAPARRDERAPARAAERPKGERVGAFLI